MDDITKLLTLTDGEGRRYWTTAQCASFLGISASTWSAYATRGQAPEPAGKFDRLKVWRVAEVEAWQAGRRSQR